MDQASSDLQDRINGDPQAGTPVIEIPKRGRGRPPGSGTKTASSKDSTLGESGSPTRKDLQRLESSQNARFLATGFAGLIEMLEGLYTNSLCTKIEKKMPTKIDDFKRMVADQKLTEKEKELIIDSSGKIIERYDILTSHAPEVILLITLGQFSVRTLALGRFVNNVTAEKKGKAGIPVNSNGDEIKP